MATEIYFVRHGESLDNVGGVAFDDMNIQQEGFLDNPLSETGERQADALCDWVIENNIRPEAIFSSGLTRSTMTAVPTAEHLGLEIHEIPEMREVLVERDTMSSLELQSNAADRIKQLPSGEKIWDRAMQGGVFVAFNLWANFGLPGFETKDELKARSAFVLDTLAARPERRVLAVAHNFFLGALLLELIDRNPLNRILATPNLGFMPNCSVTCVIAHPPRFRLRYVARESNDFS
ncbi:MAG TPA: histidine phosphatase family protein [bacterium]|nr:histidine phosphatase family protein [bacterium]